MSTSYATREQAVPAIDLIRSRHSVRSYVPEHIIPREVLKEILEIAALAPSSSNVQHWRFFVIDSPTLKQQLLPIANNQNQIVEASAVIAILGDTEGYRKAEMIYVSAAKAGYMPEDTARAFITRVETAYASMPPSRAREVAITDASMAAMQLMLAARTKGYDTGPMGGFDNAKFMAAFGIPERYVPVMLLTIGKAAKPAHPTVRLPIEEVTFWNRMS